MYFIECIWTQLFYRDSHQWLATRKQFALLIVVDSHWYRVIRALHLASFRTCGKEIRDAISIFARLLRTCSVLICRKTHVFAVMVLPVAVLLTKTENRWSLMCFVWGYIAKNDPEQRVLQDYHGVCGDTWNFGYQTLVCHWKWKNSTAGIPFLYNFIEM